VERLAGLWNRVRPDLVDQSWTGNQFLICRCKASKAPDGSAFLSLDHLADQHVLSSDGYFIPVWLRLEADRGQASLLDDADEVQATVPNLSAGAQAYLAALRLPSHDLDASLQFWLHVLAIGYAPAYIHENADGMRRDFPRIPLPAAWDTFLSSADLGGRVAALLNTQDSVVGVTAGSLRHDLRSMGVLTPVSGGQLDPSAGDLALTAGWGHTGKGGVTMPGRGRAIERTYTDAELAAFREGLADLGLSYDQLIACLGGACYDVYLNDRAYWRCVPARVWKYTIGGYQVIKKWLSYRERSLLGRDLKAEEARYVNEMTRRIAAIVLLEPALDANYARVKADTFDWAASRLAGPRS
jgi:hypothetical protein